MKILIVLTSHSERGLSGKKTGFWLEALAAPYYVFKDAGADLTLASPLGGKPPVDPRSLEKDLQTYATERFSADQEASEALASTSKLAGISAADYDALFFPSGQGLLWDLVGNTDSIALIETMHGQGKPIAAVCHAPAVLCQAKSTDGTPLLQGKAVTGLSDSQEKVVGLIDAEPLLVEDELKKFGGIYSKVNDWQSYFVRDGNLVTGQNPESSTAVARAVLELLQLRAGK